MRTKMTGSSLLLIIKLTGGGPWGFRLQGGQGTGKALTVSKIRRKSKAHNHLLEGDLLISINGIPCDNLTYDQVMDIADRTKDEFKIEVERHGIKADVGSNSKNLSELSVNVKETKTWESRETLDATESLAFETSTLRTFSNEPVPLETSSEFFKPREAAAKRTASDWTSQSYEWDSLESRTEQEETEAKHESFGVKTENKKSFGLEEQLEQAMGTKKKKMFSSSSFYEEPYAIYPTVEEQFEMAKKIAESLADDTNQKSKGANMFFKRAKRSTKWIHEGPEPSSDLPLATESTKSLKKHPQLKLVLDPRHPVDLVSLQLRGEDISEHNVISPEVCHGLVRGLESPVGKGSALFAMRKKKSSEWIVDDEKVRVNENLQKTPTSPWATRMHPDTIAESVIAAADMKQKESVQFLDDTASLYENIYSATTPKGWFNGKPNLSSTPGAYSTIATHSLAKIYNFRNFNTLPRKWKASN